MFWAAFVSTPSPFLALDGRVFRVIREPAAGEHSGSQACLRGHSERSVHDASENSRGAEEGTKGGPMVQGRFVPLGRLRYFRGR